jgi:hypothetical protein
MASEMNSVIYPLKHANILAMLGTDPPSFSLIFPDCMYGTIHDVSVAVQSQLVSLSWNFVFRAIFQLLQALSFLSERGFVCAHLSSKSVMVLSTSPNADANIKLCPWNVINFSALGERAGAPMPLFTGSLHDIISEDRWNAVRASAPDTLPPYAHVVTSLCGHGAIPYMVAISATVLDILVECAPQGDAVMQHRPSILAVVPSSQTQDQSAPTASVPCTNSVVSLTDLVAESVRDIVLSANHTRRVVALPNNLELWVEPLAPADQSGGPFVHRPAVLPLLQAHWQPVPWSSLAAMSSTLQKLCSDWNSNHVRYVRDALPVPKECSIHAMCVSPISSHKLWVACGDESSSQVYKPLFILIE